MAKAKELANLFSALSVGDIAGARTLAERIVEKEEKLGHHGAAATLRGALAGTGPLVETDEVIAPGLLSTLALPGILVPLPADAAADLANVELPSQARHTLEDIIKENVHRNVLAAHGLRPRNRIFFFGPPGCGKTLTARALGLQLNLPVYVVRFDALVGSYLGQTAARLREVFRFSEIQKCVLLIDELDAVGRRRGNQADVGELDRIVISMMQQFELADPLGVLIAASNLPNEIDLALLRRFDVALEFSMPAPHQIRDYAKRELTKRGLKCTSRILGELQHAKTYADAMQAVNVEHRRVVLKKLG